MVLGLLVSPAASSFHPGAVAAAAATAGAPGKKFAVFVAGYGTDYTERKHGGYGALLVKLLSHPGETWETFRIVDGIFPSEEQLADYSGFVVSGSAHDAHGNEAWITQLCGVLCDLHEEKKRILGVCFGHQVLSRALGGVTGRAPVGWEVGLKEMYTNDHFQLKRYGRNIPKRLRVLQSHRDQVLELPPGGTLLGSSQNTRVEMFAVEDHILGIQGHPEFTKDVLLDIIESRRASQALSITEANEAKASLEAAKEDRQQLSELCKNFLKD
ncbi:hypothetical protein SELMODRAFT_110438 [Selaginella moellendorffii]|uniref:Glutamine amidotransferase domain-containing protein n=1 Tax=Selaginella moellendorffii TaxID=88036 RepID=D8S785_SELML|nr:gamma-glutamyl peptidase 5 [Selaginella moellendorffii]EFJ19712.1 hypothetical protein SELMODRAFT_110438 [Selaginella moellendorffii]|eukprot:XP_002979304.1 gamma-glutamyl peptidase 5 [Selaginella moellendorffii]